MTNNRRKSLAQRSARRWSEIESPSVGVIVTKSWKGKYIFDLREFQKENRRFKIKKKLMKEKRKLVALGFAARALRGHMVLPPSASRCPRCRGSCARPLCPESIPILSFLYKNECHLSIRSRRSCVCYGRSYCWCCFCRCRYCRCSRFDFCRFFVTDAFLNLLFLNQNHHSYY